MKKGSFKDQCNVVDLSKEKMSADEVAAKVAEYQTNKREFQKKNFVGPDGKIRRGRGSPANFPASTLHYPDDDESKKLRSSVLAHIYNIYKLPKVHSDDELMDRFNGYFEKCISDGIIPTVEGLYMSSGYTISYMKDIDTGIERGFSNNTRAIIKKAKDIVQEYDAQMVNQGKLNPIPYIFRSKNYYGMSDRTEIQVSPARDTEEMSAEEIAKRYLEDGQTIETRFDDDHAGTDGAG